MNANETQRQFKNASEKSWESPNVLETSDVLQPEDQWTQNKCHSDGQPKQNTSLDHLEIGEGLRRQIIAFGVADVVAAFSGVEFRYKIKCLMNKIQASLH